LKKILVGTILSIGMLLNPLSTSANSHLSNGEISLKEDGILNEVVYLEERLSDTIVEESTIKGKAVKSNLKVKGDTVSGILKIQDENGKEIEKYKLISTDTFEENEISGFTGIVNDGQKSFELYLLENGNSLINIFELDENGERISPFTIHLNGKSNPIKTKVKRYEKMTEDKQLEGPIYSLLSTDNLELTPTYVNKVGLKLDTYTMKGATGQASPPWVTRLRTDVSGAKTLATQSANLITRTNLFEAQIQNGISGSPGGFTTHIPSDSGKTTIGINFKYKNIKIPLSFTTSKTSVNSNSIATNPLRVYYNWTLKHAIDFEENGIGAEARLELGPNTPRNSAGQVVVYQNVWLKYEFVGNIREYVTVKADVTNYYK